MEKKSESSIFTEILVEYFALQNKKLSDNVISILDKSFFDLNDEEREFYQRVIIPSRELIKKALREKLSESYIYIDIWNEQLLFHAHTIVGQIAYEVINEYAPYFSKIQPPMPQFICSIEEKREGRRAFYTRYSKVTIAILMVLLSVGVALGVIFGVKRLAGIESVENIPVRKGRDATTMESALLGHWEIRGGYAFQKFGEVYFDEDRFFILPASIEHDPNMWSFFEYSYRYLDSNEKGNWIKIDVYKPSANGDHFLQFYPAILKFSEDRNTFTLAEGSKLGELGSPDMVFSYIDETRAPIIPSSGGETINEISEGDKYAIIVLIKAYLAPELEEGRTGKYKIPDYDSLWNLIAESSPLKRLEKPTENPFENFKIYRKDYVPLLSIEFNSFSIEGNMVVVKCTAHWAAYDDAMIGTYPEHSNDAEFGVVKERGKWKIYFEECWPDVHGFD